jgi:hypothetical protein
MLADNLFEPEVAFAAGHFGANPRGLALHA